MGIEPTWPAWKAGALPLSYTRKIKLKKQPEEPEETAQTQVSAPRHQVVT